MTSKFFVQCIIKQLLDSVLVISRIIKVSVRVISLSLRLRLITLTSTALRFYASGSFLQVVGDTVGVDKSTVSRVVTNVSLALVAKQQQFIKWPRDQQDLSKSKNMFYQRAGFPCIIGCVDGTHI